MTYEVQTQAAVILSLNSSLRGRILASGCYTLANKAINIASKLESLQKAEAEHGRVKVLADGEVAKDAYARELEEVLAAYNACFDAGGLDIASFASLDAIIARRSQPYMTKKTDEQLIPRAKLTGKSVQMIRKELDQQAIAEAERFSKKADSTYAMLDGWSALAPDWELADIPVEYWDMQASIEKSVASYRSQVALGKVWDETDMVLAVEDIERLGL